MILVDTNIPARIAQPGHRHHQSTLEAIEFLTVSMSETFAVSVHSLYEFYFILTKPLASNGFGKTAEQAAQELATTQKMFALVPETSGTFQTCQKLVGKYKIVNRPTFDAKLVASMLENNIPRLLTFNDVDFKNFTEIVALNPFDVLGKAQDLALRTIGAAIGS